jgi:Mg-chelatase subunit ChlD
MHKAARGHDRPEGAAGRRQALEGLLEARGRQVRVRDRRAEKKLAAQKSDGRYKKFFNLDVDSRRVLFVLDFSGSMAEPANVKGKTEGGTGVQKVEKAGVSGVSKAQLVVQELKKMIMALPDGSLFNMIVFSDSVRVWRPDKEGRPTLVKIDDNTRDDLLGSFLDSLAPRGPTNLYGALDKALDLAGRGLYDKWYATSYDTLYVLSDGAPSFGKVQDKQEICRIVREANGLKKVVINTVTFGEMNDTEFLKQMAQENGGRHIHVE